MRTTLTLALALLATGCCCRRPAATTTTSRATAPDRHFVILRATPMDADAEGNRQILLESSVVSVRRGGSIQALETAKRLETTDAPVWLAGGQVPDATFGKRSDVLSAPSVVTRDGEEAVVQIGEDTTDGAFTGLSMRFETTVDDAGLITTRLFYKRTERGRTVRRIPGVTLKGPARRVFIVEALEPR